MLRRMMQDVGRPAAPPRTRFGSTCATFLPRISRSTAASCRPPGKRTHGSRRYPMPCAKGPGPWPDKLETLESMPTTSFC
jgi:hypothetical protein